jgi:hypothetical protein
VKTIKYKDKLSAIKNTQYTRIDPDDLLWIKSSMIRWLGLIAEHSANQDTDWRTVYKEYFNKPNPSLPKRKNGPNTPSSFVGGVINNTVYGTQQDLTVKQLEGIQTISRDINQIWAECEQILFQRSII